MSSIWSQVILLSLCVILSEAARPNDDGAVRLVVHKGGQIQVHRDESSTLELRQARARSEQPSSGLSGSLARSAVSGAASAGAEAEEPSPEKSQAGDDATCEKDEFAREECPEKCPYAAEMENTFCHFKCVRKNECGLLGTVPNATIPDKELKSCRHCKVEGCHKCRFAKPGETGERLESCEQCMPGYTLSEDERECECHGTKIFIAILVVGVVIVIFAVIWYCSLLCKPVVNEQGLEYALECRARSMLLQSDHDEGELEDIPYPLTTNLMTTNVAGPGMMVIFRFQFAILIWAVTLLVVWVALILSARSPEDGWVGPKLLWAGTAGAETPQKLCYWIAWGRRMQMKYMWTKVYWLVFAYVFSLVGAIIYGIMSQKLFARFDCEHSTMSDYAAVLSGIPKMKGSERVEETLKKYVTAINGIRAQDVVGVSVSWDFSAHEGKVRHALEEEVGSIEASHACAQYGKRLSVMVVASVAEHEQESQGFIGGNLQRITSILLGAWHVQVEHGHEGHGGAKDDIKDMLHNMETTGMAFVVFMTEEARDRAINAVRDSGIEVAGSTCTLRSTDGYEPAGILWNNLQVTDAMRRSLLVRAGLNLFMACIGWTVILYIPYAHYMASFSYANGDEPGIVSEGIFVGLVVLSQFGLFICSSMGANSACFHYEDQKHKIYIIFYNAALVLNLILDISLQTYLSYLQMVGVGAHTSDGRLLGSLTSPQQIFESYPIQKAVGMLLFKYCWPCTFLVPFAVEPFAVQLLPQHIGSLLIRTNAKIKGELAERVLELGEMEQGRYADIIFNVILLAVIPFVAGGWLTMTLPFLIIAHVYIYLYDQWKVLRYARKFYFSSLEVHWLATRLFAIPVGVLASAFVFKFNHYSTGPEGKQPSLLSGYGLFYVEVGAFVLSCIIHICVLEYFVKGFANSSYERRAISYADAAKNCPATHFSTNPVQCLRSKYILGDSPPLSIFAIGKEYLMKANPKIGTYYEEQHHEGKTKTNEDQTPAPTFQGDHIHSGNEFS